MNRIKGILAVLLAVASLALAACSSAPTALRAAGFASSDGPTNASVTATVNKAAGITSTANETVQLNVHPDLSYVSRTTKNGLQKLIDITDDTGQSNFDFKLPYPPGTHYRPNSNGTAAVVYNGKRIATLAKAWAKDANGKMLPTHYSFNGNIITQTVQLQGAAYPVVADPYAWWGWHGFMYWGDDYTINHNLGAAAVAGGTVAYLLKSADLAEVVALIYGAAQWCEGRNGATFYFTYVFGSPWVKLSYCQGW